MPFAWASGANVHWRLLTGGCANQRIAVREHQRFATVVLKTIKIDSIGNTNQTSVMSVNIEV